MRGQTSYFLSRQPFEKELDECQQNYLTSDKEWDPMPEHFAEAEMNVPRFIGATSSHDHHSLIHSPGIRPINGGLLLKTHLSRWRMQLLSVHCIMSVGCKTSQQQLNHKHLATKFYSDTFFT
jgi:hypothetical protein